MTDIRALLTQKIVPSAPLPHVSRKALKRVKDHKEPPTLCDCCGSIEVALVRNDEIYSRCYGGWPYAYLCRSCGAYVGLHPDTDLPLGTMADKELREARS